MVWSTLAAVCTIWVLFMCITHCSEKHILRQTVTFLVGSLVVGWPSSTCGWIALYSYYWTLVGNPSPGIQWYLFQPPSITHNLGITVSSFGILAHFAILLQHPSLAQVITPASRSTSVSHCECCRHSMTISACWYHSLLEFGCSSWPL